MPIVFDAYFYERAGVAVAIIAFLLDEAGVYQQISFLNDKGNFPKYTAGARQCGVTSEAYSKS